ncbi:MAG: LysM peptidoglycan-binding domain-containing protein [Candidatus Dactylopiibacterium sp.]|nr:LysM peptidoglycan-binding domain-containing protein [Candidatus Dactylopiibacterium sp.]
MFLALGAASVFAADRVQIAPNAPDSYVVKRGDTLWSISGMFLQQPWRWPEVWKMNQAQIRNPHLIYPGQVVVLDRASGTLSLGRALQGAGTERLSPQVHETPADSPIASVSMEAIRPFLVEPFVGDDKDSARLPTIVANQEGRVLAGAGDVVYARNLGEGDSWDIYRRGQAIKDPVGGQTLGYEAQYVARARVTQAAADGRAAELVVLDSKQEIVAGDRLAPAADSEIVAIPPHAPAASFSATVAAVYGGVAFGGRNSVVALAGGRNLGLEPGNVVALARNNGDVTYRADGRADRIALPDSRLGVAYVFRTFDRISYALIMDSSGAVKVGDKVMAP